MSTVYRYKADLLKLGAAPWLVLKMRSSQKHQWLLLLEMGFSSSGTTLDLGLNGGEGHEEIPRVRFMYSGKKETVCGVG